MSADILAIEELFDRKVALVVEHFDHKFDRLIEAFEVMTGIMARDSDLQIVKDNVSLIKKVVSATNTDLHRLENRVGNIETQVESIENRVGNIETKLLSA